jgi:hypothetical protein
MRRGISPLERKLAGLSADILPLLGSAIGAAAGGAGAPIGGALGGIAGAGIRSLIPPEQQMQQRMDRPMVIGGQGQGFIDLDQQQQQQQMMPQNMGMDFMGMMGNGLGQLGGQGIMGLMSLLNPQASPQQSLWGKMDDSLREKLVRMAALKQALGE